MKKLIEAIDRNRYLIAVVVFLATLLILNACAPLPIRRDRVEECAPLPVQVWRSLPAQDLEMPR